MTGATAQRSRRETAQPITPARFEDLYRECVVDVFRYVASLLRDHSAAEEVTAQVFERAFRRRRLFNARRGSERMWLFGIARNAALDELRRRARAADLTFDPASEPEQPQIDDGCDAERRVAVRTALATLPAQDRELVLLKFHAQLSNRELGRVLGISESNAGTRLHRSMLALRKACDEPA